MLRNAAAYRETDVMTASPSKRRLMLLEGALVAATSLQMAHREHDFEAIAEQGSHCRSILIALMTELDVSSDRHLAEQLSSLHAWLWQQVACASRAEDLDDPITILQQQRDAWRTAVDLMRATPGKPKNPSGPLDVAG
jgi:flagellar biosynthetic protein FliS